MENTRKRRARFGVVNETVFLSRAWLDRAREIEGAGIDTLLVRDHLSADAFGPQLAPFAALASAAAATTQLRIGTLVLSNDFRSPAVVANEAATLAALSDGRFELGMGAGWYEPEYRAAGFQFEAAATRVARLEEALSIIRPLLRGETVSHSGQFYEVQGLSLSARSDHVPPVLVGAGGRRMLSLAARQADIVGVLPAPIRGAEDRDEASDRLPAAFSEKVQVIEDAAGHARFTELELSAFVTIRITNRRRAATEELIATRQWSGIGVDDVWTMPTVLIGSVGEIVEQVRERQARFGLSYLVTSDSDLEAVGKVINRL